MQPKPGTRLRSAVCETEIIVTRSPKHDVQIRCGGHSVIGPNQEKPSGIELSADHASGTQMGKRLADAESGLEVLCAKGGKGSVTVDSRPMIAKETKALPASD